MLFACRNLITLVYGGQIFSAFLISTLSGVVSLGIVGTAAFYLYHKKFLGLIGTSVTLACAFNLIQLVVVNFLFIRHGDFFFQVSPLLLWSLLSGSLIAFLVNKSISDVNLLFDSQNSTSFYYQEVKEDDFSFYKWLSLLAACSVFASLFLISSVQIQIILLPILLLINRFKNIKIVYYAWPFYFYLAWLHLFRTEGIYIYKDWITREGFDNFIFFAVRTTNIILCGQWLSRYISGLWRKSAGNFYIKSIGYALPLLPALFGLSLAMGKEFLAMGKEFFHQIRNRNFDHPLYAVIKRLETELGRIAGRKE
jgi:hypothetical protein